MDARPLRVLLVSSHFAPAWIEGGANLGSWNLMRGLAMTGASVRVVTTDAYLRPEQRPLREREEQGLRIRTVPVLRGLGSPAQRYGLAPAICGAVWRATRQADVCLLQGLWTMPVAAAYAICRMRGLPHVLCARGTLEALSLSESPRRKRLYMKLIGHGLIRSAAAVYFVSVRERDNSRSALGRTPAIVAPHGFDPMQRLPRDAAGLRGELGLPASSLLLGLAGRVHPRKGFRVVLAALAHCPERVHLVSFGSDLEGHAAEFEKLAENLGVGRRFHRLGHLEGQRLQWAYASIDLLVLPSFGESFGNVVIDALLQGTEVLVSDRVALADYVERNRLGQVVAGNDAGAWSAAIRRWIDAGGSFDRARAAARTENAFRLRDCGESFRAALERVA